MTELMKVEDKDKAKELENKPKMYRGLIKRLHCRTLFMAVQSAVGRNRTIERRLMAANNALEPLAMVEVLTGGRLRTKAIDKPDELKEVEIVQDALLGIKEAVVQLIKGDGQRPRCAFREEQDFLEACRSFGKKFHDIVYKETRPPESEELDEDDLDLEDTDGGDAKAGS